MRRPLSLRGGLLRSRSQARFDELCRDRIRLERLEERIVLSASADWGSSVLPALSPAWFQQISPSSAASAGLGLSATEQIVWNDQTATAAENEWIVSLRPELMTSTSSIAEGAALLGNSVPFDILGGLGRVGQLLIRSPESPAVVQDWLGSIDAVAYFEPNFVSQVTVLPNDSSFGSLWGLNNTGQSGGVVDADIDAPEAWDTTTGSSNVVVAVIDTGVSYTHPDLAANMWRNPGEIAGNGIDDDANGFVDDVYGWDFANNDNDPRDDNRHGTHVAGTIAAAGNNGVGVTGVAWNSSIMALKFLSSSGSGSIAAAISSVNYVTMMKSMRGVNVRIASNSWGGGGFSQTLLDSIRAMNAADILFVAAAGNNGANANTSPMYPAAYDSPNIISVAATDRYDKLASFSNYGSTSVDLAAPGVDILSTLLNGTYGSLSGTSMATPHVSGAAALALSVNPNLSVAGLKSAILAGVDTLPSLAGKTVTGGRLNVQKVLDNLAIAVRDSTPGSDSILDQPPTTFEINLTKAVDPSSVAATDLTVNGIPADSVTISSSQRLVFQFNQTPAVTGMNLMAIASNAFSGTNSQSAFLAWSEIFYVDPIPTQVISTSIAYGQIVTVPPTELLVQFRDAIAPATIGVNDLSLSQGRVTGASLVGTDTIRFTLADIPIQSTINYSLALNAVTDLDGNPSVPYNGSFQVFDPSILVVPFASQTFSDNTRTLSLTVSTSFILTDLDVQLSLESANLADIELRLIAPNGGVVRLLTADVLQTGSAPNLIFDDEASLPISAGTPPYTGSYRPVGSLGSFDGLDAVGTWKLQIMNVKGGSATPTVNSARLTMRIAPTSEPTRATQLVPFDRTTTSFWSPTNTMTLNFSKPVDPVTAQNPALWSVVGAGVDGLLDTPDDQFLPVTIALATSGRSATITTVGNSLVNGLYRITATDSILDATGQPLDGDANGIAGGSFQRIVNIAPRLTLASPPDGIEGGSVASWWEIPVTSFGTVLPSSVSPRSGQGSLEFKLTSQSGPLRALLHADLAGQQSASLVFWMRTTDPAAGQVVLSVMSGSTAVRSWTLASPTTDYAMHTINLTSAMSSFTSDTVLRFEYSGTSGGSTARPVSLFLDDLRITQEDVFGPRVTSSAVIRPATDGPLTDVTLAFNEPIDPATLNGPNGVRAFNPMGQEIPILSITPIDLNDTDLYVVSFAPQASRGLYRVTAGIGVTDLAGNPMNQNQDSRLGEPEKDVGSALVTYKALPAVVTSTYTQDFEWGIEVPPEWEVANTNFALTTQDNPNGSLQLRMQGRQTGIVSMWADLSALADAPRITLDFANPIHSENFYVTMNLHVRQGSLYNRFLSRQSTSSNFVRMAGDLKPWLLTKGYSLSQPIQFEFGTDSLYPNDWYGIDEFRISTLDLNGPRVVSVTPNSTSQTTSLTSLEVEFNEPIDPTSFTASDITFSGSNGSVSLVGDPTPIGPEGTRFILNLSTPRLLAGSYSLAIGPDVKDLAGNGMDQDANGITGDGSSNTIIYSQVPVTVPYFQSFEGGEASLAGWKSNTTSTPFLSSATPVIAGTQKVVISSSTLPSLLVDLSSYSTANNLVFDFLVQPSSSSLSFTMGFTSGDGRTSAARGFSLTTGVVAGSVYRFVLDLDQMLDQLNVPRNGTVVISFSPTSSYFIDQVSVGLGDGVGPRVVSSAPVMNGSSLAGWNVTFSEPINPTSFSIADYSVRDAASNLVGVNAPVNSGDSTTFFIPLAVPVSTPSRYTLTLGPDIRDLADIPMDQNGDRYVGMSDDLFTTSADILPQVVTLPYVTDFETNWANYWTFAATSPNVAAVNGSAGPRSGSSSLVLRQSQSGGTQTATFVANLSNLSDPSDVWLNFWFKEVTVTASNTLSLSLSTDGVTYLVVPGFTVNTDSTSAYTQLVLDVDQALAAVGLLPDADIYFRFGRSTANAGITIDDLRLEVGGGLGPMVTSLVSNGVNGASVASVTATFDRAIDPTSVIGQATMTLPTGSSEAITSAVVATDGRSVTWTPASPWTIRGSYTLTIAPTVRDLRGSPMNQNRDIYNGFTNDGFSQSFTIGPPTPASVPFQESFESSTLNDLTSWSFATPTNSNIQRTTTLGPRGTNHLAMQAVVNSGAVNAQAQLAVNLSGQSYANLFLSLWGKRNSSDAVLSVDVSGNGTTWFPAVTNLVAGTTVGSYASLAFDLGMKLSQAGIALDNDVYVRWTYTATGNPLYALPYLTIDDVRVTTTDVSGPAVVQVLPNFVGGSLQSINFVFNEEIDVSTFSAADIYVGRPNGTAVTFLPPVDNGDQRSFTIPLAQPESMKGNFFLSVGPNITDRTRNLMNQNGNGVNGEAADAFQTVFNNPASAILPDQILDFESGLFDAPNWTYDHTGGNSLIDITTADNPIGSRHLRFSQQQSATQFITGVFDLSSMPTATNLFLSFDAKMINTFTNNTLAVQVSGNGIGWTTSYTISAALASHLGLYKNFAFDLDQLLRSASIAFDSDVYVRLLHTGGSATANFALDNLRVGQGTIALPPVYTSNSILVTGGVEDTMFNGTASALLSRFSDPDSAFELIVYGPAGTLTVNGQPVVSGVTRIRTGDTYQWIPPANASGNVFAFRVAATDNINETWTIPVSINLSAVNDAPVLNPALVPAFAPVVVSGQTPPSAGTTASVLTPSVSDPDTGRLLGMALVGSTGQGQWQYAATSAPSTFTNVTALSESNALLLSDGYLVRFVPDMGWSGNATLQFYAWDRTTGTSLQRVNVSSVSSRGGSTSYSLASAVIAQRIDFLSPGGPYVIPEGGSVSLAATLPNATGSYSFAWDLNNDNNFTDAFGKTTTLSWAQLNALGIVDGPSVWPIRVRVTGTSNGTVVSDSVALTVQLVPPTAMIASIGPVYRGEPATFQLLANDPSRIDQFAPFQFEIDWNNDSVFDQTINTTSPATVSYTFNSAGSQIIQVRARDRDGALGPTSSATFQVLPYQWQNGVFTWFGTAGDDDVAFQQVDESTLRVTERKLNGVAVGNAFDLTGPATGVTAFARAGNDVLDARLITSLPVILRGGEGNDSIVGGDGPDQIFGENGLDTIWGGRGNDTINGGNDNDLIFGDYPVGDSRSLSKSVLGRDSIAGGSGNDTIYGDGDGGEGMADTIFGEEGNDTIFADGSEGSATVAGDFIDGGTGDDSIVSDGGEGSPDTVYGSEGSDFINTGGGSDFADGGDDNDILLGGDGVNGTNDTLLGGAGRDILVGDGGTPGVDLKSGGVDSLRGGSGEDLIVTGAVNLFTASDFSWLAVRQEWVNAAPLATRRDHILGITQGLNGSNTLSPSVNLFNDRPLNGSSSLADAVFGDGDADWILLDQSQEVADTDPLDLTDDLSLFPLPN